MAEPLWHSRRICDPITRQPLAWHHWAGLGVIRVGDLRELAVAAPGDLPATVREGLPTIMRALPEAWAAALRSVAPPAQWLVSPDAADRRVWSRAPDGSLGASHVVSPTGALMPAPPGAAGGVLPDGLQPALVRPWAPGRPLAPTEQISSSHTHTDRGRRRGSSTTAAATTPPPPPSYLVGGWESGTMDHSTWGVGASPSHQYIVQVGTTRQLILQRMGLRVTATLMAPCAPPSGQTHQTTPAVDCARWSDSGRQHMFFF